MLLTTVWERDAFLVVHPPVDLLAAAYLGYKAPLAARSLHDARKANTEALAKLPPQKNRKTLAQMPAFLRTPEMMAMYEKSRAEWQTKN